MFCNERLRHNMLIFLTKYYSCECLHFMTRDNDHLKCFDTKWSLKMF